LCSTHCICISRRCCRDIGRTEMAPKVKKLLTPRAKAKLKAAKLAAKLAAAGGEGAEVVASPSKPKVSLFKKKVLASLAGKSVEEAAADFKKRTQVARAELQEAQAMEKAQNQQAEEAKKDYEKAKTEIDNATQKEMEAAAGYKAIVAKRSEVTRQVEDDRKELYESQKKVAMLEVLSVNHAKMKALEDIRKKAQANAEEAKRNMLEQKQREKEALEATRRALAEVRAEQKGQRKRMHSAVHPDEAETLPATQAAADID